MKKNILVIWSLIFMATFSINASNAKMMVSENATGSSLSKIMKDVSAEVNKGLPIMVDAATKLESTEIKNRTFQYNYKLIGVTASQVDGRQIKSVLEASKPALLKQICGLDAIKPLVKNSIPIVYAYHGNQGKEIAKITIPLNKCK